MLAIMALFMKALIPGGFMPGFNNGTFTAEICAESSSTSQPEQLANTHHKPGKDGKERAMVSHGCPYATLVMAAVSDSDVAFAVQTLIFIRALGFIPVVGQALQHAARLRPPLRGPPPVS